MLAQWPEFPEFDKRNSQILKSATMNIKPWQTQYRRNKEIKRSSKYRIQLVTYPAHIHTATPPKHACIFTSCLDQILHLYNKLRQEQNIRDSLYADYQQIKWFLMDNISNK